jgi:hypothetical protein
MSDSARGKLFTVTGTLGLPVPAPFGCACANSGTQYAATATARKPNVEPGIAFTIVFA